MFGSSPVGQHDFPRGGSTPGGISAALLRHDNQLVIGIIERGERRQIFAQPFVLAFDRHDDGGRRQCVDPGAASRPAT